MKRKLLFINTEINYSNLGPKRKSLAQLFALQQLFSVEHLCLKTESQNRWIRAFHYYLIFPIIVFYKAQANKDAIIYYRYYYHCLLLNRILPFLKRQHRIYVELNTKSRQETRLISRTFYLLNWLSEKAVYKSAYQVLVITPEVGDYVRSIVPGCNIKVMGNGYDPMRIDVDEEPREGLEEIRVALAQGNNRRKFIWVGGVFIWDGFDRILEIISQLPDSCLYLVGSKEKFRGLGIDPDRTLPGQVFFLGQRGLDELEVLYAHCHYAFGSFGQEKKFMTENPTLKVREYLYYGLPVIIGHKDPQLQGVDFIHQYKDMESLHQFLTKPFDRNEIRQYALSHLSWRTIMRNIFAQELMA